MWVCSHCAMIEGALQFKPHWQEHVDIRRIDFAKPREQVIELLGEDNQWLPVLILKDKRTITDLVAIINHLANAFGGVAAHP